MARNVMIELRHSAPLAEIAASATGMTAATAGTAMGAVPLLPGLRVDPSFPPVSVPSSGAPKLAALSMGISDLEAATPEYDALADFESDADATSFIIRGEIEDDDLDRLIEEGRQNEAVVGIFSDPAIQVCLVCPGSPPMGTDTDVARLLCTDRLQRANMDGHGVLVAIVDTGISLAYLHAHGKFPNLDTVRSWSPPSAPGTGGAWPVNHGTMCAYDTLIAAPKCTLLDIALLRSTRPGGSAMDGLLSDAVLAYRHLLNIMLAPRRPGEARSLVVNNSWGMFHPSWDFPIGNPGNYSDNPNHPFNRIVTTLERAGADILFAAGNCGHDCPDGRCQGVTTRAIYGANSHSYVTCVAGVDITGQRVGYSSTGPGRLSRAKPDVCGFTHFKGSGVYAADGGTSAATPVVTGLVAALRSRHPYVPGVVNTYPARVRQLLRATALDRGAVGFDYEYGWGIVNGCRLSSIVTLTTEPTTERLYQEMVASADGRMPAMPVEPVPALAAAETAVVRVSAAGVGNGAGMQPIPLAGAKAEVD